MPSRSSRLLAAGVIAASALAFAPATDGEAAPAAACDDTVGREVLTTEGLSLSVAAPAFTAPELAATAEQTGETVTPHRSAHFYFTVDLAPYESATLDTMLEWFDTPSDYDLVAYTYHPDYPEHRLELGKSQDTNIEDGDTRTEGFSATVVDCQRIDVMIRSWAGSPAQDLALDLTLTPQGDPATDVAARPADSRIGLYLAGDRPGNLGTPQDTVGAEYPFSGRFSEERPTSNLPNATTRPVAGSTIEKNPVQPWWAGQLDTFPTVQGNPSALVWLSSPTQQEDPGTVYVQLFLNGTEHTVEIPGDQLTHEVRPYFVEFPAVDEPVFRYSLQISALPVASPNTASEHLGDANHTVWFDSVQYQSRLYLPVAG